MMISFFLLTLCDFDIKNDRFDYLGNTIYRNSNSKILSGSNSFSWYFIHFSFFDNINCIEKLSKENGIFLDVDSQITSNICLAFLNSDNITSLQSYYRERRENIYIQPLENNQKLHDIKHDNEKYSNHKNYNYIARFHKSFTIPPNLSGNFTKLSDEIYLYSIKNEQNIDHKRILNEVLSIPSLRSISPQSPTKLMNRWNSGLVQKNEWPGGFDIYDEFFSTSEIYSKGDLRVNRYLNNKGLNGTGQIITIVDSGLDITSPYFSDKSEKPFEYEKIDMNRRKVVFYTCFGNNRDSRDMHGTHIAGISAGDAIISDDFEFNKLTLYNGVAPGAKLSIVDITENDDTGTNVLNYPSILLGEAMGRTGSKIALCGWGNSANTEQSYYYDMLAQFNPTRLFVFAAGNRGPGYMTVTTPGDGKNVLTVGALDTIWTSMLETRREYILTDSTSTEQIEHKLNLLPYGRDLFYTSTTSGKFMIENARIVDIATVSSKSLKEDEEKVYISSSPDFCNLIKLSPWLSAAIFIEEEEGKEPLCPPETKLNFPVFISNDTTIQSYEKSVTIKILLPQEDRTTPRLQVAQYSSRGPNYVGIQKPDVVAPGSSVYSADSSFVSASDGTSNAAAYVAGASALVYEYFEKGFYPTGAANESNSFVPTSDLVRAIIVASADPLPSFDPDKQTKGPRRRGNRTPDTSSGHGLVNLANVITFSPHLKVFRNLKVDNDQHFYTSFTITPEQIFTNEEELDLRIACAYQDPASTNNYLALQTNIDMYLVLPNGTIVHGNHRPEENEERFSTVERILIYKEELLQIASNSSNENYNYELHFVTGGGFSNLPHYNMFSITISGPFVNEENSAESSTGLIVTDSLPYNLNGEKVEDFKFVNLFKNTCGFPSYGVLCQHNATEISVNETAFDIPATTAKLCYINIPMNYTRIVLHLRREPSFSGRLALQFAINNIFEYGTNYPFIVSLNGGSSAVGLGRSMFGANKFIGLRISNMVGTDIKVRASITYEVATPDATPTQSAVATMPKNVFVHLTVSYTLCGFFFIVTVVFFAVSCYISCKIKKNKQIRGTHLGDHQSQQDSNMEMTDELLKNDPL